MSDDKENFDDFENEDFDFLDGEEETSKVSTTESYKTPQNIANFKKISVFVGIIFAIAFIFSIVREKSHNKTEIIASSPAKIKNSKPEESQKTAVVQIKPEQKEEPQKEEKKQELATTTSEKQNTTEEQKEATKQEMADLFTEKTKQHDLATITTKQSNTTNKNMNLIFGNNPKASKLSNTDAETTSDQNTDNSVATTKLQETVESITHDVTENVNQIKQLEEKLNKLSSLLTKLNQNVTAVDSRMLGLTESVDSLTQDISHVKKVISDEDLDLTMKSKKSNRSQLNYKPPGYSIHAIIPGRAWLKSPSGQIITVAEGDNIGDYGTVAVIDAANNVVRTSSGISFR